MGVRSEIREYLADVFGEDLATDTTRHLRWLCAAGSLEAALDGDVHVAENGDGRLVLVTFENERMISLSTLQLVGDDQTKMDEVRTVWLRLSTVAKIERRITADRDYVPVVELELQDSQLPGGLLRFHFRNSQGDQQRATTLLSRLVGAVPSQAEAVAAA